MLTQKKLKDLFYYNPNTGIFINKIKRGRGAEKGAAAGYKDSLGYITISVSGTQYRAHRLAFLYIYNKLPETQIDHINHIRDDNRIDNLREVSQIENSRNSSISKKNTSGFTGVSFHIKAKKWRAQIFLNGKSKSLGLYNSKEMAIQARKKAEIKYGFHENHGKHYGQANDFDFDEKIPY